MRMLLTTVRMFVLMVFLIGCGEALPQIQAQTVDHYSLAMKAWQASNYPAFLENIRHAHKAAPFNVGILRLLSIAWALNHKPSESVRVLQQVARLGASINLEEKEYVLLKGHPAWRGLRAAFQKNDVQTSNSQPGFTLAQPDLIPEGIAYDEQTRTFYIGSIYQRKIVCIQPDGTVTDFTASRQDGLMNVLGLKVDAPRRHLWVCVASGPRDGTREGSSAIFKYDLTNRRLLKKYEVGNQPPHLFNDIVIAGSGDAYFTDSLSGAVWKISSSTDSLEVFLPGATFSYPNGIALSEDDRLLLIADECGLHRIQTDSRRRLLVKHPGTMTLAGIDGLVWHQGKLIAVQNGFRPERIIQITLNHRADRVRRLRVLESRHASFDIPTTGVVAPDGFYYIANSQLRKLDEKEVLAPLSELHETMILKLPLSKKGKSER